MARTWRILRVTLFFRKATPLEVGVKKANRDRVFQKWVIGDPLITGHVIQQNFRPKIASKSINMDDVTSKNTSFENLCHCKLDGE